MANGLLFSTHGPLPVYMRQAGSWSAPLAAGKPRCLLGQELGAPLGEGKGTEAKGSRHPLEDEVIAVRKPRI